MKKSSWVLWGGLSLSMSFVPRPANAAVGEYEGAIAKGDFDGDGDEDLVVSSPQDDCGKGVIHISSNGSVVSWTRDTPGVLGTGACYQYFGTALAVGDFDNDGYDDLAVSTPGASDTGDVRGGAVHLFYGRNTGLSTVGDQVWTQDTIGVDGVAEAYDYMGDTLEVGDFDCDGYDDLVVGVPREDLSGGANAGAVHVLYGSSAGVSTVDDWWHEGIAGVNGAVEPNDHFGGALAAGNFNGDTSSGRACDDLAIASPGESVGSIAQAGFLYIMDGSTSGLSTSGDQAFHQDTSGVVGSAETYDRFGEELSVVDENNDGFDDIAVLVPGDACEAGVSTGRHVLRGTSSGITTVGNHLDCHRYGCVTAPLEMFCAPRAVHLASGDTNNDIALSDYDDVALAGTGSDEIRARAGDDVVLGGTGNDEIVGGPGRDLLLGGAGNDTFEVSRPCHAEPGELIDGGPGSDTIVSPMTQSELLAAGVVIRSVENFVVGGDTTAPCNPLFAAGRFTRPASVPAVWANLPSDTSSWSTTNDVLELEFQNTRDATVKVYVTATVRVSGVDTEVTYPAKTVGAGATGTIRLQTSDFIPAGVDLATLNPAFLNLPVSARLSVYSRVEEAGEVVETPVAPIVYGHVENTDTLVFYRQGARDQVFFGGDLVAYRASANGGSNPHYLGVFEAR
ncbi:MAG: FG-GAP-like repeat-containing protein [Nannocystales bacterium]